MTCREFAEFLCDWLDGDLPAPQAATFESHRRVCHSCPDYAGSYRTTRDLCRALRAAGDAALPPDLPEALVLAVLSARRDSSAAPPD